MFGHGEGDQILHNNNHMEAHHVCLCSKQQMDVMWLAHSANRNLVWHLVLGNCNFLQSPSI